MIVVKHKDTSLNIKGRFVKYIQTIGVLDKDYLLIRTFKWLQKICLFIHAYINTGRSYRCIHYSIKLVASVCQVKDRYISLIGM